MMFRGALVRLAAQYFLLLVLILGFFDLIVYVTVSQSLQAKADNDLKHAVTQATKEVVPSDTVSVNAQGLLDPIVADTFVRVLDIKGQEKSQPQPALKKLFNDPSLKDRIDAAMAGQSADTRVSVGGDLYMVHTSAIVNPKSKKVVGVMQVAQPVSWVGDALSGLIRQLVLASGIAILLGALASLLMATRSLRPISRAFQRQREFVADASHELRTPLTLIRTNVEAWLRRSTGQTRTYAQSIVEEVEQLNRIVGDLTTLALAERGARRRRPGPRPSVAADPDRQRALAYALRRPGVGGGRPPERPRAGHRDRHRGGDPDRRSPAYLRALLPGRQGPHP